MKALPICLFIILSGLNIQAWRGHPDMVRGVICLTAIPMILCIAWLGYLFARDRERRDR